MRRTSKLSIAGPAPAIIVHPGIDSRRAASESSLLGSAVRASKTLLSRFQFFGARFTSIRYLLAQDLDLVRGVDTQANLVAAGLEDGDDDVIVDEKGFAESPSRRVKINMVGSHP